ncbi:MAG: hypothetical protein B6241_04490 [Spirochaetaceae bacterium 4572_59]|nr:MAG: hypothetical protein B6241_04490 [Spirochaetaceae bacterium 4572_59]
MSDGSLSQDEIDALLMGNDSMGDSDSTVGSASSDGLSADQIQVLNGLFGSVAGTLSSTMTGIMATDVTIAAPHITSLSRDELMNQLSNEVVEVKMDFNQGLSGGHAFLFSPDDAIKIAGPMIGQNDVQLDGTAISAVGEAVSQLTGAEVTTIGDTISDNIMTISPESQKIAKGLMSLGGDTLVQLKYPVTIEGQGGLNMIELFELPVARSLAEKLGSGASDPMAGLGDKDAAMNAMGMPQQQQQQMGNMGMPGQQMGNMGMPGQQMGNMGMPGQQMGNMGMSGQQMGNMGMPGQMNPYMTPQQAPNVQGVQFPEFGANISPSEQRNIGLLMDVSMELTVELGRAKWQIKDILGIGEGTIIELDKLAGEAVDILVNGNLIAKGEVVVIDENFGVRVTDIVSNLDRVGEN